MIQVFLEFLFQHPYVDEIFNKFKGKNTLMSAEDFHKFLKSQGEDVSLERAKEIIAEVGRKKKDGSPATTLTSSGFMAYFMNPKLNSIFNPNHQKLTRQPYEHQRSKKELDHNWKNRNEFL